METRRRLLDAEHPKTLASKSNLALTYRKRKDYVRAEETMKEVMTTRKGAGR